MKKLLLLFLMMSFVSCALTQRQEKIKKLPKTVPTIIDPGVEKQMIVDELKSLQKEDNLQYKISPGDIFGINVYDEPDLTTSDAVVKPDGTISIKVAGEVSIKGLTLTEAQEKIEEKLSKYIKYPKVTLLPVTVRTGRFTILGKINKPGIFTVEHDMRVLDAIASAGGFATGMFQNTTVEMADLRHSFISRDGELLPVDFVELVKKGNLLHNVPLKDGDYIYIKSAANKEVFVIGEVNKPGFFAYKEDMTLLHVITRAGGMNNFASSQVVIIRNGLVHPMIYSYNFNDILRGESRDVRVKPDDVVFVTKSFLGTWNQMINLVLPAMQSIQSASLMKDLAD